LIREKETHSNLNEDWIESKIDADRKNGILDLIYHEKHSINNA